VVTDQLPARARELAEELGGRWVTIADRRTCMLNADIVIAATGCPHVLLTCDEAEGIARERNRVALVIMDIGIPRDVDPEVHRVDGIMLYDLAGLERATQPPTQDRMAASEEAERIVAVEAQELLVQTALVGR
jgi:glutamyl-tRNA reductase